MIVAYATAENGEGRVMRIGEYEDWDEIKIVCGLFAKDTIINFEIQHEKNIKNSASY